MWDIGWDTVKGQTEEKEEVEVSGKPMMCLVCLGNEVDVTD